jgi:hypothetical protein
LIRSLDVAFVPRNPLEALRLGEVASASMRFNVCAQPTGDASTLIRRDEAIVPDLDLLSPEAGGAPTVRAGHEPMGPLCLRLPRRLGLRASRLALCLGVRVSRISERRDTRRADRWALARP